MKRLVCALALFLLLAAAPIGAAGAPDSFQATVTDISDRAYEPAVTKLLRDAKRSISISMYSLSFGREGNNPVKNLFGNLLDAAKRGVTVTLYLNTNFQNSKEATQSLTANPLLKELRDAGAEVHILPSGRKVHDKLIIVDSRYVVEGSSNWSIAALRTNRESDTLIDSPGLAAAKLQRLQEIPLKPMKEHRIKTEPAYIQNLPATMTLPDAFVEDQKYLRKMFIKKSKDVLDLYLILEAQTQATGQRELFVDLETMALSMGKSRSISDTDLRKSIIVRLRILERRYGLIKVAFFHGRDAKVTMVDLPGSTFTISTTILMPKAVESPSARMKYYFIIKAYLASKGENIDSMTVTELGRRFNVGYQDFSDMRKDLKNNRR